MSASGPELGIRRQSSRVVDISLTFFLETWICSPAISAWKVKGEIIVVFHGDAGLVVLMTITMMPTVGFKQVVQSNPNSLRKAHRRVRQVVAGLEIGNISGIPLLRRSLLIGSAKRDRYRRMSVSSRDKARAVAGIAGGTGPQHQGAVHFLLEDRTFRSKSLLVDREW